MKERFDIKPSALYRHIITQLEQGEYNADQERELMAKIHALEPTRDWIAEMSDTERQMFKIDLGASVRDTSLPIDVFALSYTIELLAEHGLNVDRLIDEVDDSDNLYELLNRNFYSKYYFIR